MKPAEEIKELRKQREAINRRIDEGYRKGFEKGRHAEAPKMFFGGIIIGGIATIWAYLLLN